MTGPIPARVRHATGDDLEGLLALAATVEGHLTTMPRDRRGMAARIEQSLASRAEPVASPGNQIYLFVLEEGGEIIGTSAIYATVGLDRPFYNYKLTNITRSSPELGITVNTPILAVVNDYAGCAEVGTLYLHPDHRGQGRGRLLSLARFLFIAAHRSRFPDRVLAEMRGWTDDAGKSPFWEAVGRRFFHLDLGDADALSGHSFRFIADLLPTYPIYVDLLPDAAQAVIGVPHPGATPAAAMLEREGLHDNGYLDVFDAGICLDGWIADLAVCRKTRTRPVRITDASPDGPRTLVANPSVESFTVISTTVPDDPDHALLGTDDAARLLVGSDDPVRTYIVETAS